MKGNFGLDYLSLKKETEEVESRQNMGVIERINRQSNIGSVTK